jgi:hypothetical protein
MSENRVKTEVAGWESLILFIIMLTSASTSFRSVSTNLKVDNIEGDIKAIKEYIVDKDTIVVDPNKTVVIFETIEDSHLE